MDRDRLDTLQRQASMSFLEGDVEGATAAWRKILDEAPEDENALEGLRMCEQWDREAVTIDLDPPQDVATPAVEDSVDDALNELDLKLDLGPTASPEPPPVDEAPDVDPIESQPEPAAAPVFEWGDGSGTSDPGLATESEAAGELRRRIADLIGEVRSAMEQGDDGQARSTVDRVLILDEENVEAMALRDEISARSPSTNDEPRGYADGVELDLTDEEPELTLEDEPPGAPPTTDLPNEDHGSGDDDPVDDAWDGGDSRDDNAAKPRAAAGAASGLQAWLRPPKLYIAAAVIVVLAGGLWSVRFLGSGDDAVPVDPPVVAETKKKKKNKKPQSEAQTAAVVPAPVVEVDPADLFQQAEAATDAGDFTSAILTFDKLVKLEPDNVAFKAGMDRATGLYREQQAKQQKWVEIAEAFETHNYKEALRILYRLPDEGNAEIIEGNIISAWYNLGVDSLRTRDCPGAVESFEEARALSPSDAGVEEALALALDCGRTDPKAFRGRSRGLPLRTPEIRQF